jgi:ABC-2 type transport system permease protein
MRNVWAQAKRIWQQFSHDPRTVVMFVVAPVLALWLFSILLGSGAPETRLGLVDLPAPLVTALEEAAEVTDLTADQAESQLAAGDIDASLTWSDGSLQVKVEGTDAGATGRTLAAIQAGLKTLAGPSAAPELEVAYLHGSADWTGFDFLGPVFIGIFVFVFVFITAGMSLVTERTGGTMERLLVTPIKSWQLVAGYCLGFGAVTVVQTAIILWACVALIGFPNQGSIGLVILTTLSMALVSMTLGLLVSALASTAFQVIQLMILLVVPQILLSGIFDLAAAPRWMQVLSVCLPIRHGADALRGVMLRGDGLEAVGGSLGILWGFIAVFFALASLSFRARRTR